MNVLQHVRSAFVACFSPPLSLPGVVRRPDPPVQIPSVRYARGEVGGRLAVVAQAKWVSRTCLALSYELVALG